MQVLGVPFAKGSKQLEEDNNNLRSVVRQQIGEYLVWSNSMVHEHHDIVFGSHLGRWYGTR